ncbi:hypothetical protein LINPERPRIM_LOCUS39627 [Linum perenne]
METKKKKKKNITTANRSTSYDRRRQYYFPEDLISDIQRRLPLSCTQRLRSVSKSWNSVLSNPNFIYSRLFHEEEEEEEDAAQTVITFILHSNQRGNRYVYNSLTSNSLLPIKEDAFMEIFPDARSNFSSSLCLGSCDGGIICFIYGNYANRFVLERTVLFNPATQETKMLPPIMPSDDDYCLRVRNSTGFALLDQQDDDDQYYHYKVVSVCRRSNSGSCNFINRVHVFSSDDAESSLDWRELPCLDSQLELWNEIPQYGLRNKKNYCYWLAQSHHSNYRNRNSCDFNLVSFDPKTEVWRTGKLPSAYPYKGFSIHEPPTMYMVKDETLMVIDLPKQVLFLQKCPVGESWCNLFTIEFPLELKRVLNLEWELRPLALSKHDKLICTDYRGSLKMIDVTAGKLSTLPFEFPDYDHLEHAVIYVPLKMSL